MESDSRSASPTKKAPTVPPGEEPKEKRFLNGWTSEQERLMAEWSDLAMCYRWLHDKSEKHYHNKNLWITLPVIILTTLGGTANFGIQSLFSDNTSKQYASFAIGGISLFAGLLTTIGNYLRYAQSEEANRVASIAWGKFQRLIAVELALNPDDRMDSLDFLKICRVDLDRLIEQSPPIPELVIDMFTNEFGVIPDLKKPDICGALEHTRVFESKGARLKQLAVDAAIMMKQKKSTLNEFLAPNIQKTIKEQVDSKLEEAIEKRKQQLEEEIQQRKEEMARQEQEVQRVMEERQRKIQEEIEAEKKKQLSPAPERPRKGSMFQERLYKNPLFSGAKRMDPKPLPSRSIPVSPPTTQPNTPQPTPRVPSLPLHLLSTNPPINVVIIPTAAEQEEKN